MTVPIDTRIEPRAEEQRAHGGQQLPDQDRDRLQMLVGELLSENQKLRFENEGLRAKTEQLKQEAQSAERGLKQATKWAGIAF
jgi:regulator of replication initiation timing